MYTCNFKACVVAAATSMVMATATAQQPGRGVATDDGSQSLQLEEIVVTAQRREQSIFEVPLAITALDGDSLAEQGITNSVNLASAVPNLQISSSFGNTQPNFSMRGVSVANEYNSNQASPVGVYVDDVYIAARSSQGMGLFDLDRVEVLRGPQGTLFGRNTTGGAINFITKKPSLSGTNGYAELGYGNFNTLTGQTAVETTVSDGQLGFRVAGNYVKGDGQLENVYPGGRDPVSQDTVQGRVSMRYKPNDGIVDITLRAYLGDNKPYQAAVQGLLPFREGLGFFQVDENRIGKFKSSASGVAAHIAIDLPADVTLTSITSVDKGDLDLQQAADGSPLDVLDINWKSEFNQVSEELRFNYSNQLVSLVGGVYYGRDKTITDNTFGIGSVFGPGVDGGFFQHYQQIRRSTALFLQGDINLSEKLVLTVGARYTKDSADYEDGYANLYIGGLDAAHTPLATTVPCQGVAGTCAYDPNARFAIDGSDNALTGRVALSYTLDNGLLTYLSYNRGYRSGAFNGGGYTSSVGITYIDPETVNAYEAGFKGRLLDNSLALATAVFYYDYQNQQLQDTRPGPVSFLVNAPKSEIYGAETELTWVVAPSLTVRASAGYLHATYKELTLQDTDISGNKMPFAPTLTGQFGFDWTVAELAGGKVTFSPKISYASQQYFSPFNDDNAIGTSQQNSELQQGAYSKVDASLSWKSDKLLIRAWSNNLLNREAYGYGLDLRGAGFPYNFLVPSTPRTYGVNARVSF